MEKEPKKFDKKNYDLEYKRKNQKRIPLDVQQESYEKWKNAAEKACLPLNTFIKSAVEEKIAAIEAAEK